MLHLPPQGATSLNVTGVSNNQDATWRREQADMKDAAWRREQPELNLEGAERNNNTEMTSVQQHESSSTAAQQLIMQQQHHEQQPQQSHLHHQTFQHHALPSGSPRLVEI